MLNNVSLLHNYFICSSLYLLIPNSQFVPSLFFFPFGNHNFIFYECESFSVLYYIHLYFFISHISGSISYLFSLVWLIHEVWYSLGPSMLMQMAVFHSFNSWVIYTHTHTHTHIRNTHIHAVQGVAQNWTWLSDWTTTTAYMPHLLGLVVSCLALGFLPCLGYCM